nr:uncharacterized protein LOC100439061 [Pongo abelii]
MVEKTVDHLGTQVKGLLGLLEELAWNLPGGPFSPVPDLLGKGEQCRWQRTASGLLSSGAVQARRGRLLHCTGVAWVAERVPAPPGDGIGTASSLLPSPTTRPHTGRCLPVSNEVLEEPALDDISAQPRRREATCFIGLLTTGAPQFLSFPPEEPLLFHPKTIAEKTGTPTDQAGMGLHSVLSLIPVSLAQEFLGAGEGREGTAEHHRGGYPAAAQLAQWRPLLSFRWLLSPRAGAQQLEVVHLPGSTL